MKLQHELTRWPAKEKALEITAWIGNDAARFAELMDLVLGGDPTFSKYASWLLSHCMEKNPQLLDPYLEALVANLAKPDLNDSVVRSTIKALAGIEIPAHLQGHVLQHGFDLLLDPKIPVSIQVHAMQAVFNISKTEPDLLRELQVVIEDGMLHGTAGYKSRGKRILLEIGKMLRKQGE